MVSQYCFDAVAGISRERRAGQTRDRGGHRHLTLDRPGKLNAITPAMASDLVRMCREIDADPSVRVVLLSGTGSKGFCAGTDLDGLAGLKRPGTIATASNIPLPCARCASRWSLHSTAGCSVAEPRLALSADLRIADETVTIRLSRGEERLGSRRRWNPAAAPSDRLWPGDAHAADG